MTVTSLCLTQPGLASWRHPWYNCDGTADLRSWTTLMQCTLKLFPVYKLICWHGSFYCGTLASSVLFVIHFSPPRSDSFRSGHVLLVFLFFFTMRFRAVSANRREILYDGGECVRLKNKCPKFQGAQAKSMQNLAWFWSTSNLNGKYLRNGWRY